MLPGGFKKDSRVWLHKNSSSFPKKAPLSEGQRIGLDEPYGCVAQDQLNCSEPVLTDASGRIYKKDSRTWLHKVGPSRVALTKRTTIAVWHWEMLAN